MWVFSAGPDGGFVGWPTTGALTERPAPYSLVHRSASWEATDLASDLLLVAVDGSTVSVSELSAVPNVAALRDALQRFGGNEGARAPSALQEVEALRKKLEGIRLRFEAVMEQNHSLPADSQLSTAQLAEVSSGFDRQNRERRVIEEVCTQSPRAPAGPHACGGRFVSHASRTNAPAHRRAPSGRKSCKLANCWFTASPKSAGRPWKYKGPARAAAWGPSCVCAHDARCEARPSCPSRKSHPLRMAPSCKRVAPAR
jgi:hypothetical protein